MRKDACGYTMSELAVVTSVVAVVALSAVPAFTTLVADHRRVAAVNDLVAALNHARHSSIMDRRPMVVCASSDGNRCDGEWSGGWITFAEPDGWTPAKIVAPASVVHRGSAVHGSLAVVASRARFHFRPSRRRSTNGSVVFCAVRSEPRAVVVSWTGRIRTTRSLPDWAMAACSGG